MVEMLGPWMRALSGGNLIGSKLLLCAAPRSSSGDVAKRFEGLFSEISVIEQSWDDKCPTGWPRACNHQFVRLAKHIDQTRPDIQAFYFFEPDNLPLRRDWFQVISGEYQSCGKPFWGIEQPNVENGAINGTHMIGTGIYPRDAWSRIKVYEEIETEQPGRPFDVLHRHEVNPQCHFTKLAIHCASMTNYTPDGFANYPTHFNGAGRFPMDIPREACILHGCKDSSLHDAWGVKIRLPMRNGKFLHTR